MFSFLSNKWFHVGIVVLAAAAPAVASASGVEVPDFVSTLLVLLGGGAAATAAHQNAVGK